MEDKLLRKEVLVATAAIGLVLYTCVLSAMASMQTSQTIPNTGSVRAVGVGVFWNAECTDPITAIAWGQLDPGSSTNVTGYIRNDGDAQQTLSLSTSNWSPTNASNALALTWNYGGQPLTPSGVIPVTWTLTVTPTVEGITTFSFDITIEGTG